MAVDAQGAVALGELVRRRLVELGALGALALGAILTVPGLGGGAGPLVLWPLGAVLASLSAVWEQRDRLVGLIGPVVVTVVGVFAVGASRAREDLAFDLDAFSGALFGLGPWIFLIAAPAGTAYLGWRLLRSSGARRVRLSRDRVSDSD
jgi:hypothetical protein